MKNDIEKVLITEEELQGKIKELAAQLESDYQQRPIEVQTTEPLSLQAQRVGLRSRESRHQHRGSFLQIASDHPPCFRKSRLLSS